MTIHSTWIILMGAVWGAERDRILWNAAKAYAVGVTGRNMGKPNFVVFMQRIWPKVIVTVGECWEWSAYCDRLGYGKITINGTWFVHRYTYLVFRDISHNLELDHLCRNPSCCNPEHLEPVTHAENVRRGSRASILTCKHGHPFNESNTYHWTNGKHRKRICRKCGTMRKRAKS